MADTTTVLSLPFPEGSDANDVPADIEALATRLDEVPGIESLTSAEIAALAAGAKPAGRVVYNSTTSKLQVSNGTSFADVDAAALAAAAAAQSTANAALPKSGGTMTGAIAMGSSKITGLGSGTASTDAATLGQVQAAAAYARGTRATSQSVADGGTVATVTYTAETDPDSILNTGTGTVTIPTTGLWSITGFAELTMQNGISQVTLLVSGSVVTGSVIQRDATYGSVNHLHSLAIVLPVTAGGTVTMTAIQTSGDARNIAKASLAVALLGV